MSGAEAVACDVLHRPTTGADRMRLYRQRRVTGQRLIHIDLVEHEVRALVAQGWLAAHERDDNHAITVALGRLLERVLPP